MLKGISMAARALKNQVTRNDIIANNLANTNTTGFKKDIAVFRQEETPGIRTETRVKALVSYDQGPLVRTERALDVAIQGEGFFVLDTDEGERYTRAGSFVVNQEGALSTVDGLPVSSSTGTLIIPPGEVDISPEGFVTVDGVNVGKIRVVRFADSTRLVKAGSSAWTAPPDASPEDVAEEETVILSGFIEASNVNVISEMTEMITALKAYEVSQKMIKSQDEILQMLTNKVGTVG
ncbi:MAG: flagellar hook-basal body protein [Candidatus Krumholzibacteriota bacterium]|nr:flagellar hook-basal body protein [Candidatus Krumholzibacteriota bacterium]